MSQLSARFFFPCSAVIAAVVLGSASVAAAAPQLCSWSDDFNRPNAPTLGSDWTDINGSFGINNNRGFAANAAHFITVHNTASISYAQAVCEIDCLANQQPPPLHYVGLAIGFQSSWESVFIKLQDNNGDGLYDRIFFWRAVNAGASWNAPSNFDLAVPTSSARLRVYFTGNGDVAHAEIDRDFDGSFDEHFSLAGILASTMNIGSQVAVVTYGAPAFDNFCVSTPTTAAYCTSSTTTSGCSPALAWNGVPSASATSGFDVTCPSVEGQKSGLIFYGVTGTVAFPWAAGSTSFLCVKSPTQRTPLQSTGGSSGACNGALSVDLLAWFAGNPGALGQPIHAGQQLYAQAWFRDPPAPKTTNLSNALQVTLVP